MEFCGPISQGWHVELNSDFVPIPVFLRMGNHAWNQNILGDIHTMFIMISLHVQIPRSKRNKTGRNTHCELSACLIPFAALVFESN